jgi:hypothetical protein
MSQRAQSFIKTPKFFKGGISSDFQVTVDDHDRILTVSHGKNPDNMEFILAEVVAKFSENKTISEIWKINFREIESFLRDENHLPAFAESTQEIESVLIHVKASLIGFAVKAKFNKQHQWIISQRKNWNQLSLTAKNEWAQTLIRPLGWELIFCEGDVLTVTNTPTGMDAEALSLLINAVLSGEEIILPMKVVAV